MNNVAIYNHLALCWKKLERNVFFRQLLDTLLPVQLGRNPWKNLCTSYDTYFGQYVVACGSQKHDVVAIILTLLPDRQEYNGTRI